VIGTRRQVGARRRRGGALRAVLIGVTLARAAQPAAAQEPTGVEPLADLAAAVADEVTRRLNSPATDVRVGDLTIPGDSTHSGDLAVVDGDLALAGRVDGDVLVVNGDFTFMPGAVVMGGVLVVGGTVQGAAGARVDGEIITHTEPYAYELLAEGYRHLGSSTTSGEDDLDTSDFLITTGKSYNRVEGLPIAFGPRLRTQGSNPLRLQALAIYRTETGLSLDVEEMGYFVRADQYVGGWRTLLLGASLYSIVDPIEEWHITDLETGLATFFFHRDYRDHFERTGASLFATWEAEGSPLVVNVEGRWEKHALRPSGSPWSVFRNAEEWRPQPIVAEGRIGSIVGQLEYDSRSEDWNPASGWLVRGQLEQAFRVELDYPDLVTMAPAEERVAVEYPTIGRFVTGLVDVRSYNRVDADARLNFRLVAGGSLTGDPLPPQRQHALGGEGSLPGYQLFTKDCGARGSRVTFAESADSPDATPFFPHYGCDGFGLFQAEFRGKLAFRLRWDGGPWNDDDEDEGAEAGVDLDWDLAPDWSLFVDAGRGWSHNDTRLDEETHVNVGAGLLLDRLGIYIAVPVTSGSGVNLFIRLGPRF
jgi:hypothetical protein